MTKCLCILCFIPMLCGAENNSWRWSDREDRLHTLGELESILKAHHQWINKQHVNVTGEAGAQANLSGAHLVGANLSGAELRQTNLHAADLQVANLSRADLMWADLSKANLGSTNLSYAIFYNANLSGADLSAANLTGADLSGTNLGGANLRLTDLALTNYEPTDQPPAENFILVTGLGSLRYRSNSGPIYVLRRSLAEAGFTGAEKQVTAAIHRHNQGKLERILFDWTCEWGANWLCPLKLVAVLSILCTFVYWLGMHFSRKSGLYLAATGQRITTSKGKEHIFRIRIGPLRRASGGLGQLAHRELTSLGTAFLFSLMSVFNIGFREFNFGRWIRMVQPREFDIRARGWMRTVSGLQSLLGVAFVALAVLSYFGHPFD